MNYGGSNDVIQSACPRCSKSPDTHKPFPFVSSGDATQALILKLQQALADSAMTAAVKDYQKVTSSSMMGAAVAQIGSAKKQYLTLSGMGVGLLAHIDRKYTGKDVILLDFQNAAPDGQFLNSPWARKQDTSLGKWFTPAPPAAQNRGRDYPLGSCAAQKLIAQIYADAIGANAQVETIELAELLWFDTTSGSGHNRDWSTGQIVMSCDTCKQVVPQILCSNCS